MSKAEYILGGQYVPEELPPSAVTPRASSRRPGSISQIFGAPLVDLAAPAQMPLRIGFECVRPEDLPVFRGVENITTSENRMHHELSAV